MYLLQNTLAQHFLSPFLQMNIHDMIIMFTIPLQTYIQ